MLPRGSLRKVYKHYFTTPRYSDDILRAMREFFDRPDLDRGGSIEYDEKGEGLFNEWLMYDFPFIDGKPMLADFVKNNPLNLSAAELVLYSDLLKSNKYGMYEVISIDRDVGMQIKNVQTKRTVYVRERALTYQANPGYVFFSRVGKVGDHYELVGADTFTIGKLEKSAMRELDRMKFKLTPKEAYGIWSAHS